MKSGLHFLSLGFIALTCAMFAASCRSGPGNSKKQADGRPNILFVLADDQSFPYASAYGTAGVKTPSFDEVARSGILFNNAFAAAPQCSPSRAAILTGKNIWQLEEAGTHSSYFPHKFPVFTDLLENAGYSIGYTGKGWGPGNWKDAGWKRNPAGPEFNKRKLKPPTTGISNTDYFENFEEFYNQKKDGHPFFFWYGSQEPHRKYEQGSGKRAGKDLSRADVPSFLPDDSIVRSDIEDYALEIEWFDSQLGKMIDFLRQKGELENTLIVVTSDNGMPFPSAKANLMEYGTHVPLAISWPSRMVKGSITGELVSLIDLAPTFLELAGIDSIPEMTGKSLTGILFSSSGNIDPVNHRAYVLTGRERHTHAREDDLGYPSRAIRTDSFLFIWNCKPDRWPAGNPPTRERSTKNDPKQDGNYKPIGIGYNDIDDPSPSKEFLIRYRNKWPEMFSMGFGKRPEEQLFDIIHDPGCTRDLAGDRRYASKGRELRNRLQEILTEQKDPRVLGNGDIFESYPRFGLMRNFPGFKERGKYNEAYQHHLN